MAENLFGGCEDRLRKPRGPARRHGQQGYLQLIEPGITPERRVELRQGLLAYYCLDTLALVRLAWYFEGRAPVTQQ